jgi:hypothetical protein
VYSEANQGIGTHITNSGFDTLVRDNLTFRIRISFEEMKGRFFMRSLFSSGYHKSTSSLRKLVGNLTDNP